MKSIVQEGTSIAKAIEKALQIAGNPSKFTVKVLEEPLKNFFGMTTRSAKISLLFDIKEVEKSTKAEKPRAERPKAEKPRVEKPRTERRKMPAEKTRPARAAKETSAPRVKSDDQVFWTENMVETVKDWLNATIDKMEHAPVSFETDVNRYYLRITFAQPLRSDEAEERQVFSSFSYLILQSLRTKLQRPLRGFKVVLTRG